MEHLQVTISLEGKNFKNSGEKAKKNEFYKFLSFIWKC